MSFSLSTDKIYQRKCGVAHLIRGQRQVILQNPFERDQVLIMTAASGGFEPPIGDVEGF